MAKVMAVYGTRPEAIKMAPLIEKMRDHGEHEVRVVVTGQHREMLDQVNSLFSITPHHDLDLMRPDSTLTGLASRGLQGLDPLLTAEQPDAVVVQGDTTSAFVAGLASFYARIPVVHLEAGLRTHNLASPFPEEGNRRLLTSIARLHLAPTAASRANLIAEDVPPEAIALTGNTVIDALVSVSSRPRSPSSVPGLDRVLNSGAPLVLATLHRRESWGPGMVRVVTGLAQVAASFPETQILLPMHRNPLVRKVVVDALGDLRNVVLTEPLSYVDFVHAMSRSRLILTDSGGVQEEAPSLGVPVLVARDTTERPEAVEAGAVRLVGTDLETIVEWMTRLLTDDELHSTFARTVNPYGDGHAAARAAAAIDEMLGRGNRLPDFEPQPVRTLDSAR